MIGRTLSHYKVLDKLGEGGMGVVYRAIDTRLDRPVALKVLRAEAVGSAERRQRFVREAKAASALNHPNIVTVHDIGREPLEGRELDFIVMELVDGKPLRTHLESAGTAGFPVERALGYAVQLAGALAAAHAAGIVHRDVKPANLMITSGDQLKVLDFGLAKLVERGEVDESGTTFGAGQQTEEGAVLGTAAYMSPEQAEGKAVDARSDLFSFGVVLYEMLSGRRPFQGDSQVSTRLAILREAPQPLKALVRAVPAGLERIVLRCLEKKKEARYASAAELLAELRDLQARLSRSRSPFSALLRNPRIALPAAVAVLAASAGLAWYGVKISRIRWARQVALAEIARLSGEEDSVAAFRLVREAERIIPGDRELERLWGVVGGRYSIRSDPTGAEVYWRDYKDVGGSWEPAGRTPIENAPFPKPYLRWRFVKQGFETIELGSYPYILQARTVPLSAPDTAPAGMVQIAAGTYRLAEQDPVEIGMYWLDRYEVTNREFKRFADAGGYSRRELWKHRFVKDDRELSWEEAMAEFKDVTGRPGPSTWQLGSYPDGEDDFPVRGVSWFEAAAFAEFSQKSLPTVYHWLYATDTYGPHTVVEMSNFDGKGPARVGSHQGLGPWGTYDMAGNVKEWCWNRAGTKRHILGGSWDEPVYMYRARHAQSPFDRAPTYGFRCARYAGPLAENLTASIERFWRDYSREKPVADDVFEFYRSIYAYDRTELKAATEPQESGSKHWRKERIAFDAAYGSERMVAYLFLPEEAAPPYQTVIYFPGSGAEVLRSPEEFDMQYLDFVIRSGRAVMVPAFKGTYDRRLTAPLGPQARRDLTIQRFKDLARSIDYLETREDIDREKLAYYGFSLGALYAPIFGALEGRLKTIIVLAGGLDRVKPPSEVDPFHFTPRVRMPVLMLNGREDFRFPLEDSQKPMFRLLGTPESDKRLVLFNGGHISPVLAVIRETLDWLDRYLGPVKLGRSE